MADAEHMGGTAIEEGQQRDQTTNFVMASPGTSGINSHDHVGVWASLQVARKRWNICEVVKDTGWWSWTVIKDRLGDGLVFSIADVRGKNYGLWVLGINREICNSDADLIEIEGGVRD